MKKRVGALAKLLYASLVFRIISTLFVLILFAFLITYGYLSMTIRSQIIAFILVMMIVLVYVATSTVDFIRLSDEMGVIKIPRDSIYYRLTKEGMGKIKRRK